MAKAPFSLNLSPLDAETREIAERELNETPERSAEAVRELRELLHKNTDLHYRDDDQFLISILRPCHFYPESAIKLVSFSNTMLLMLLHTFQFPSKIDIKSSKNVINL